MQSSHSNPPPAMTITIKQDIALPSSGNCHGNDSRRSSPHVFGEPGRPLSLPMPLLAPNSLEGVGNNGNLRPASVASNHSNSSSNTGTRTTAISNVSRRGRSRSPAAMSVSRRTSGDTPERGESFQPHPHTMEVMTNSESQSSNNALQAQERLTQRGTRPGLQSQGNPSSAAAAAAAAAISLSRQRQDSWIPSNQTNSEVGNRSRDGRGQPVGQTGSFTTRTTVGRNTQGWPGEDNGIRHQRGGTDYHPSRSDRPDGNKPHMIIRRTIGGAYAQQRGSSPASLEHYGDGSGTSQRFRDSTNNQGGFRNGPDSQDLSQRSNGRQHEDQKSSYSDRHREGVYQTYRYGEADHGNIESEEARGGRIQQMPHGYDPQRAQQQYFTGPVGMAPPLRGAPNIDGQRNKSESPSSMITIFQSNVRDGPIRSTDGIPHRRGASGTSGTSRVIGTATPIHVPRARNNGSFADPQDPTRHMHSTRTASSVFRGRPNGDTNTSGATEADDDNSPQRILLSLRTPTTSFEERDTTGGERKEQQPSQANTSDSGNSALSPVEPPQIQHSHHQHKMSPNLFFDSQRSSSPKQNTNQSGLTLEMAPSFSLFNQSFDSLGDTAHYLNGGAKLDSNLQSNSFGIGLMGSIDNDPVAAPYISNGPQHSFTLTNSLSMGPYSGGPSQSGGEPYISQTSLEGTGGGGSMLMLGMSPMNSFGNGVALNSSPRGSGDILLGPDEPSSSPTLMQPSHSGINRGAQPQPELSDNRSRITTGRHEQPMHQLDDGISRRSPNHMRNDGPISPPSSQGIEKEAFFYAALNRSKRAFLHCSFLLPGLKEAIRQIPPNERNISKSLGTQHLNNIGSAQKDHMRQNGKFMNPTPAESAIAMRRITSAVCGFGGNVRSGNFPAKSSSIKSESIFRKKDKEEKEGAVSQSPADKARAKYEEALPNRYYENENRLSWEFEESPPVEARTNNTRISDSASMPNGESFSDPKNEQRFEVTNKTSNGDKDSDNGNTLQNADEVVSSNEGKSIEAADSNDSAGDHNDGDQDSTDQPKMRYRCKLCGQPKQNHTCIYQQSLQRNIGAMVYPAVNAFTSNEPGVLAPALSEMNNFVFSELSSTESSPSRPTPDRQGIMSTGSISTGLPPQNVTPETLRSAIQHHRNQMSSPGSSLSTGSVTPQGTPFRHPVARFTHPGSYGSRVGSQGHPTPQRGGGTPNMRKRTFSQVSGTNLEGSDLLFVDAVELKPEQYRIVTPRNDSPEDFTYPHLPLPYAQRKSLSDNLFALSKGVPQLTEECATVLKEARERDQWDVAVAELMTQVLVVVHCPEGDNVFDGLRQYLLTLGLSC